MDKDMDLSTLLEGDRVNIDNNVYQIVLQTTIGETESVTIPTEHKYGSDTSMVSEEKTTETAEEGIQVYYVVKDNSRVEEEDKDVENLFGEDIYTIIVEENDQRDDEENERENESIVDDKISNGTHQTLFVTDISETNKNSGPTIGVSNNSNKKNTERQCFRICNDSQKSKPKILNGYLDKDITKILQDLKKVNRHSEHFSERTKSIENAATLNPKATKTCSFCLSCINPNIFVTYFFNERDQRDLKRYRNKRLKIVPKIICDVCLNRDYVKRDIVQKSLGRDEYLTIRNNVQSVYKKKVRYEGMDLKDIIAKQLMVDKDKINCRRKSLHADRKEFDISKRKESKEVKLYCCRICGLVSEELPTAHCLQHLPPTAEGVVLPCVLCPYGFTTFKELSKHMVETHQHAENRQVRTVGAVKVPSSAAAAQRVAITDQKNAPDNRVSKKGLQLLEKIMKEQTDAGETDLTEGRSREDEQDQPGDGEDMEEWLDEDTGIITRVPKKPEDESVQKGPMETAEDFHQGSDSDSDGGVWIVQAEEGAPDTVRTVAPISTAVARARAAPFKMCSFHQCTLCRNRFTSLEKLSEHVCREKKSKIKFSVKNTEQYHSMDKNDEIQKSAGVPIEGISTKDDGNASSGREAVPSSIDENSKGQHKCNVCKKSFHTKIRLQFHLRYMQCESDASSDPVVWTCGECPQLTFNSEVRLYDHVHFSHRWAPKHPCPYPDCQRQFRLKSALSSHLNCHTGERKYHCAVCDKLFLDKQTLNEHEVTHLKRKPFQCPICRKCLNRKSRLRMHILGHTQPRSALVFSCRRCCMTFATCTSAQEHVTTSGECPEQAELSPEDADVPPDSEQVTGTEGAPSTQLFNDEISELHTRIDPLSGVADSLSRSTIKPTATEEFLSKPSSSNSVHAKSDANEVMEKDRKDEMLGQLPEAVRRSITVVETEKVYRCEYCERVYWSQRALNVHRAGHTNTKNPFTCHICGAAFSTYSRCTTHKTTHGYFRTPNGELTPEELQQFPVVKHFLCEVCGKSYLHWTYLQVHRRLKHSENVHMYTCLLCEDQFPNSWSVAYHRKKVHGQSSASSAPVDEVPSSIMDKMKYSCAECGLNLESEALVLLHQRAVHPSSAASSKPAKYTCAQCEKRYATTMGLRDHIMKKHTTGKTDTEHTCKQCNKPFLNAVGLNVHIKRVHMKQLESQCGECGKRFYSAYDLRRHTRRHSGERPYPCHLCCRSFRTGGVRDEHLRIHSGEQPYSCEICGQAFRRPHALRAHRLTHAQTVAPSPALPTHDSDVWGSDDVPSAKFFMEDSHAEDIMVLQSKDGSLDGNLGIIIFDEQGNQSTLQEATTTYMGQGIQELVLNIAPNDQIPNREDNETGLIIQKNVEILTDIFEDESQNQMNGDRIFLQDRSIVSNEHYILQEETLMPNGQILVQNQGVLSNGQIILQQDQQRSFVDGKFVLHDPDMETSEQFIVQADTDMVFPNQSVVSDGHIYIHSLLPIHMPET